MDGVEPMAEGVTAIDTMLGGMDRVTSAYLIHAPRPALIECGPALSIDAVLRRLDAVGLDPDDLAYLIVSHIHLDHAGGAGDLLETFKNARVVVSEFGADHLVDPQRLNASSRRVYGALYDEIYGDCRPIDTERVIGATDGDSLDLGAGRHLELLYTPGHAKHHMSAFDPDAGALFVGDSLGVKMPGMQAIRPATPPPDFDIVLANRTIRRYQELEPQVIYLAHYGAADPPMEVLDEASELLAAWFGTAEAARQQHDELDHVTETLVQRFTDEFTSDGHAEGFPGKLEMLSGYRQNAMGLLRYFQLRDEGRVTPSG